MIAPLSSAVALYTGIAAGKASEAAEAQAFAENPLSLLVATPGRLMAHMKAETPAFTLTNLQFLVSAYSFVYKSRDVAKEIDKIGRMLRK